MGSNQWLDYHRPYGTNWKNSNYKLLQQLNES